jgi:glycosyltransferase involved in cell wall biosynthesis
MMEWKTGKTPVEIDADDAPRREHFPTGETIWDQHLFRSRLCTDELEKYEMKLRDELPPDDDQGSIGGIKSNIETDWNPFTFPGHRLLFNVLLNLSYWFLVPIDKMLSYRKRKIGNRPICILRIVSVISQGGVAKVCLQSLLPMDPHHVENHLFVFGEKRGTTPELENQSTIRVIGRKTQLWPGSFRFKMFRNIWKLMRIIRQARADLIHSHEPQFAPVIRMAATLAGGIPVCLHLHNDYNIRRRSIRDEFLQLTRHALRRCHLIACSQTIHKAGDKWLRPTRHPIRLIEDGSDDIIETVLEDDLPDRLEKATGGRLIVTMMSHLVPHKRINDFLYGCRILLDEGYQIYVLLMAYGKVGDGRRMRKQFNRMFEPEEGEFLYRVQNPQRLMPQIGIGVSTSILEGLGLNILEYQVCGIPVVCTNILPHCEMVVDEKSGFLFEPFNLPQFLRAMRRLIDDPELRDRIGRSGKGSAEKRVWADTAHETVRFYKDVLNS